MAADPPVRVLIGSPVFFHNWMSRLPAAICFPPGLKARQLMNWAGTGISNNGSPSEVQRTMLF